MSEILAPCGSIESLAAALNTGADAVYIGMKEFSARKNAENFSVEELKQACEECHRRGVKLYAALNTLVYDSELEQFAKCVETAAKCGVDGIIVQDLGAVEIIREVCPEMPLHASTQMTLNSVCGVKAAQQCGFSRVVIGRELSESEIKHIAENTSAELEVFVHGALCVSISGQCYMSSVFGGRSGNRGLCAQPCRLDFTCGDRHNVISLKDSSLILHLPKLQEMGIASYKIEGRMKRPEYVACAADACYKSLKGEEYDAERLGGIFSRGGLTDGYFSGSLRDMQGIRGKEDVENSAKALNGIKALYKDELPRLKADIHVTAAAGEPISASARCGNVYANAEGGVPQAAKNASATEESVCERMAKLGGTQFFAGEITADVDEGLYIPAAELNALRRSVCEQLDKGILERNTPRYNISELQPIKAQPKRAAALKFRAEVATAPQLSEALSLPFELVYAPMKLLSDSTPNKERIAVMTPLFLADCEEEVRESLIRLKKAGFSKGVAHTLGHAELLKETGFEVLGGYRLNVINSRAAGFYERFGLFDITLSFEGTAQQLSEISCGIPRGILAYGRLPLMAMRRCPIADGKPCGAKEPCGKSIRDRRGNEMPVLCGGNYVELLNPDLLIMSDRQRAMAQFDFALLKFTTETQLKPVLDMYLSDKKPSGSLTRGLYFRGAE
ncbi:MAG: U32 family peptidase [Oscillospiraceae bacterium]|nr:U32 family peptidase [Oscillospiraceae bacterium]